ncbi:MAG: hypothetical protein JXJ22_05000, partial [Bacteroidales bacterium]|nr:hypothetical protein [Bacteroidales bacterium]
MNSVIKIITDYESLKDITIQIDPYQIREVLMNILNNAFQAFSDNKGNIKIKGFKKAGYIHVDIQDNGNG